MKFVAFSTHSSTETQMAKYFFKITQFGQKWIYSVGVALACVFEKNIPLNATWILDRFFGFSNSTGLISFIFSNGFTFGFNYCIWKMISVHGYLISVDILIGGFSLTFCIEKAHRYCRFCHVIHL